MKIVQVTHQQRYDVGRAVVRELDTVLESVVLGVKDEVIVRLSLFRRVKTVGPVTSADCPPCFGIWAGPLKDRPGADSKIDTLSQERIDERLVGAFRVSFVQVVPRDGTRSTLCKPWAGEGSLLHKMFPYEAKELNLLGVGEALLCPLTGLIPRNGHEVPFLLRRGSSTLHGHTRCRHLELTSS